MNTTTLLVIITCAISILSFSNVSLFEKLKHFPYIEKRNKEYFRWLTSGFVHGDYLHLGVNMFVLYQFGSMIEEYYTYHFDMIAGQLLFIVTYVLTIVMADIPTYFKHQDNQYFASVGASGGVSGIVFFYILLYPWNMLGLYAIIPVPAIIFGGLYLWYSSWASKNQNDIIDHDAHFYGAIAGVAIAIVTRPVIIQEFIHSLLNEFPL